MAIRQELKQFCETTTVKGVSRVAKSQSKVSKVLWTTAVLFGASFATFQLSSLFVTYYSYGVTIKVEEQRVHPAFPDVTICNLNPLNSAHNNIMSFEEYLEALDLLDGRWVMEYMFTTTTHKAYTESFSHLASLTGYFQNMELPDFANTSTEILDNLIISCKFYRWDWSIAEDIDCLLEATNIFWDPSYNYCATLTVTDIDPLNDIRGLTLISYIGSISDVVAPSFAHNLLHSKSMGLMVSVHPPNTLPDLKNGMMVAPGHETTIHVTVRERFLSGYPYGDCQEMKMTDYYRDNNSSSNRSLIRYSETQCESICQQKHIRANCKCISPGYFAPSHFFHNTTYCGNFSIGQMAAALRDHMHDSNKEDWNNWEYQPTIDEGAGDEYGYSGSSGYSSYSGSPEENSQSIGRLFETQNDTSDREAHNSTSVSLNKIQNDTLQNDTYENSSGSGNSSGFGNIDNSSGLGNNDTSSGLGNNDTSSGLGNNDTSSGLGNNDTSSGLGNNDTSSGLEYNDYSSGYSEFTTSNPTVNGSDGDNSTSEDYEFVNLFGSSEFVLQAFNAAINKLNCITSSDINVKRLDCDCPIACQSIDYTLSQSQSPWPHLVYQPAFFCKYIKKNPALLPNFREYDRITQCDISRIKTDYSYMYEFVDKIRQNFLQLNVKLSYARKNVYKDLPALTWDTLFSNIGGTLNLWIGVTFMTLVEVCELILRLIGGLSCGERKNKVTSSGGETEIQEFKV